MRQFLARNSTVYQPIMPVSEICVPRDIPIRQCPENFSSMVHRAQTTVGKGRSNNASSGDPAKEVKYRAEVAV